MISNIQKNRNIPEWRTFQQRNREIETAADRLRNKTGLKTRDVTFYSVGVKCRGTLWTPKSPLPGNPVILLCHGWGGLRAFLDVRYASKFVEEGFHVLSFDYRGWGSSDGKLVPVYDDETIDQIQQYAREEDFGQQRPMTNSVRVRVIRQVVDSDDQLQDIEAAISFLSTLGLGKIGIFGSSHGGGHVLEYGSRDPSLVSCIVSQVPSLGKNGAGDLDSIQAEILEARQKSALKGWIPRGASEIHLPAMDGAPIFNTLALYDPLKSCSSIHVPTLIIDVEHEDLWDVNRNGLGAFKSLIGTKDKEYYILRGVKHYDAYKGAAGEARKVTLNFFKKHLVVEPTSSLAKL